MRWTLRLYLPPETNRNRDQQESTAPEISADLLLNNDARRRTRKLTHREGCADRKKGARFGGRRICDVTLRIDKLMSLMYYGSGTSFIRDGSTSDLVLVRFPRRISTKTQIIKLGTSDPDDRAAGKSPDCFRNDKSRGPGNHTDARTSNSFIDSPAYWEKPCDLRSIELVRKPVSMKNLGWVSVNPFRSFDNMIAADEKTLIQELIDFKALGGSTIVQVTPSDAGRDAPGLQRLARLMGVNVICGTTYYQSPTHPEDMTKRTVSELKKEFVKEVMDGIWSTGARAGIIGQVGNAVSWHGNEGKCCAAAVGAQLKTGAAISIHPGQSRDPPFAILRFLKREGADISRVIMDYADTRLSDPKDFEGLAKTGCFEELDTFGFSTDSISNQVRVISRGCARSHRT